MYTKKLLIVLPITLAALFFWVIPTQAQNSNKTIKIASFNIKWLSHQKAGDSFKGSTIVNILNEFDLVAIQEIRDKTNKTMDILVKALKEKGRNYRYILGPRLPKNASRYYERYAFIFDIDKLESLSRGITFSDPNDRFVREPLMTRFKVKEGNFDFVLVNIHTKPESATAEINALTKVIVEAARLLREKDIIVLGDFNADCAKGDDYYDETELTVHFPSNEYISIIPNSADTNLAETDCTYDRIITTKSVGEDYVMNKWGVYKFDEQFDLTYDKAKSVSDHYPVWAEFFTNKDRD